MIDVWLGLLELGRCRFLDRCRCRFFFSLFFKVGVGSGLLNNHDVGVDFDYLTNIALQGKSVLQIVYNIHEVCKKLEHTPVHNINNVNINLYF